MNQRDRGLLKIIALAAGLSFPIVCEPIAAQDVLFEESPRDLQLFPRNAGNSAPVVFAGVVTSPGHARVRLAVLRDGQPFASDSSALIYAGDVAPFQLSIPIQAELAEYTARFYVDDDLVVVRDSLVCGDILLINGQSNAVAGDFEGLATATSEWFRSFGTTSTNPDQCRADTTWGRAQGHIWYSRGFPSTRKGVCLPASPGLRGKLPIPGSRISAHSSRALWRLGCHDDCRPGRV